MNGDPYRVATPPKLGRCDGTIRSWWRRDRECTKDATHECDVVGTPLRFCDEHTCALCVPASVAKGRGGFIGLVTAQATPRKESTHK